MFSFFFNQIEEKFTKHLLRAPVTFVEDDTSIHQILYQVIKRILQTFIYIYIYIYFFLKNYYYYYILKGGIKSNLFSGLKEDSIMLFFLKAKKPIVFLFLFLLFILFLYTVQNSVERFNLWRIWKCWRDIYLWNIFLSVQKSNSKSLCPVVFYSLSKLFTERVVCVLFVT